MASFEGSSITRPYIRVCRRYPGTLMLLGSINMACISSRDSFFRSAESQNHTPSDTACITTPSVLSPACTCNTDRSNLRQALPDTTTEGELFRLATMGASD